MPWLIWRLVLHPRIPDGLADIRRWYLPDVLVAHLALDAAEEIDDLAREQAEADAKTFSRRARR